MTACASACDSQSIIQIITKVWKGSRNNITPVKQIKKLLWHNKRKLVSLSKNHFPSLNQTDELFKFKQV